MSHTLSLDIPTHLEPMNSTNDRKKIDEMIDAIRSAANNQHNIPLSFTGENYQLDELAIGINGLIEELHVHSAKDKLPKKSFYVALLEQLQIGVSVMDKHFRYIYCNHAYFNDGDLKNKAVGKTDIDLFRRGELSGKLAYGRYAQLWEVRQTNNASSIEEVFEKEGEKKSYLRMVHPFVRKWKPKAEFFICYRIDASYNGIKEKELILKNEKLEKAKDELDEYLHHVTHDLKAPLSSLEGLINISIHTDDRSQLSENLDLMKKNVRKMEAFIKTILDYSRNNLALTSYKPINFRQEVEDVIQLLKYFENAERIHFNVDVICNVEFYSDSTRIHMILNNLISNSIKYHNYNQENPYIHVIVRADEMQATLIIYDNGEGIEPESYSKIFKSFERISAKSKGSGLGLYLVKEVVDKLNGKIRFESALKKGTRFEIVIPNAKVGDEYAKNIKNL